MSTNGWKNGVGRKVLHLRSSGNHFGDKESFQNDGRMLNIKGAARFTVGIEEGIQDVFFGQRRVENILRKEQMM